MRPYALGMLLCGAATLWSSPTQTKEEVGNPIKVKTFTMGPYVLHADQLAQMPAGLVDYSFPEPVWVLSYQTEILDAQGNALHNEYHCHTMLQKYFRVAHSRTSDMSPFKGLYSDGNTTKLSIPEGFGVYYEKDEKLKLMPMFNNRDPRALNAAMRFTIEYVPAAEVKQPMRPLYGVTQSIQNPHLYYVPPGIDEREAEFQFAFAGTIHVMGVHIHPYGKEVELINATRGQSVWKAVGNRGENGRLINMPVWTNYEGYPFRPDEKYKLRVVYDNPTMDFQDAMGGFFILFTTDDDKPPQYDAKPDGDAPADDHAGHHGHH